MAFSSEQRVAWLRANPKLRAKYQRRWRAKVKRKMEIIAAKQMLRSAERLRTIGIYHGPIPFSGDSWQK